MGVGAEKLGGRPIDKSRPKLDNKDGSFSTERTVGIEVDGKHYVIPTIVKGKRMSEDEAVDLFFGGKNEPVGVFNSREEADSFAKKRTKEIGRVRGTD